MVPTFKVTANKHGEPPINLRVPKDELEAQLHVLLFNDYVEISMKQEDDPIG